MVSGTSTSLKGGRKTGKAKEKIFHPSSRKAGQLERASLRKSKLATASSKRSQKHIEKADSVGFWFYALPPDALSLTLEEVHTHIRDVWLLRYDEAIRIEESSRRKGRPPSKREMELRALKVQAEQDYRSGIEMPDLTHARTVELLRQWNGDPAYLHLLRFIRVSSTDLASISIVRYGLQERGKPSAINQSDPMAASSTGGDTNGMLRAIAMDTSSEPDAIGRRTFLSGFSDVPASRFSSTMPTMDS